MNKENTFINTIIKTVVPFCKNNTRNLFLLGILLIILLAFMNIQYLNLLLSPFISFSIILLSIVWLFKPNGKFILVFLLFLYILLLYFTLLNRPLIIEQLSEDAFFTLIVATIILIKDFRSSERK